MSLDRLPLCYLCKSNDIVVEHPRVRDRSDIQVLKCKKCELTFLSRMDHVSNTFYEDSGMFEYSAPTVQQLEQEEKEDTDRRVAALQARIHNKSLLDFGCGSGGVLKNLKSHAKSVAGLEPNRVLRENLEKNLNVPAYRDIKTLEGRYDFISLFHVLEHLPDPSAELKNLAQFLNAEGRILIEVPSAKDALISLYDLATFKDFTYWSCHLYLFTPQTLTTVIERAGLKILKISQIQRYPLSNHLYWLRHGKPGGHKTWSHLRNQKLDTAYAETLAEYGACDTLWAEAGI